MNYNIRSCNWYWYVKGIRRGICHVIHQYAKTNNKYMKDLNLPFLPERMKIGKVQKLAANLHDKNEYVIHIRNLKQDYI